jgi:deoxyadenosine/deoxycytidine kinase
MLHPTTGWTVARLLEHLRTAEPYVAVAGIPGAGKSGLAGEVLLRGAARLIAEPIDDHLLAAFYADPSGLAWGTELEFLDRRRQRLCRDTWAEPNRPAISDFWFGQSLALASVWLPAARYEPDSRAAASDTAQHGWSEFQSRWEVARASVMPPKLIVWLDAAPALAASRISLRARAYEQVLTVDLLQRLRSALAQQLRQADVGPILRLTGDDFPTHVDDVVAAISAMGD